MGRLGDSFGERYNFGHFSCNPAFIETDTSLIYRGKCVLTLYSLALQDPGRWHLQCTDASLFCHFCAVLLFVFKQVVNIWASVQRLWGEDPTGNIWLCVYHSWWRDVRGIEGKLWLFMNRWTSLLIWCAGSQSVSHKFVILYDSDLPFRRLGELGNDLRGAILSISPSMHTNMGLFWTPKMCHMFLYQLLYGIEGISDAYSDPQWG